MALFDSLATCDAGLIFPSGSQSILFSEIFCNFYQKSSDLEASLIFKHSQKDFYFNLLMDYGNSKINLIKNNKEHITRNCEKGHRFLT